MKLQILAAAETEIVEARDYLEGKATGLGGRFIDDLAEICRPSRSGRSASARSKRFRTTSTTVELSWPCSATQLYLKSSPTRLPSSRSATPAASRTIGLRAATSSDSRHEDRASIHRRGRFFDRFGQCRMRVAGSGDAFRERRAGHSELCRNSMISRLFFRGAVFRMIELAGAGRGRANQ